MLIFLSFAFEGTREMSATVVCCFSKGARQMTGVSTRTTIDCLGQTMRSESRPGVN